MPLGFRGQARARFHFIHESVETPDGALTRPCPEHPEVIRGKSMRLGAGNDALKIAIARGLDPLVSVVDVDQHLDLFAGIAAHRTEALVVQALTIAFALIQSLFVRRTKRPQHPGSAGTGLQAQRRKPSLVDDKAVILKHTRAHGLRSGAPLSHLFRVHV